MVDALVHRAALYRRLVGARIRSDWQYRTSFFVYATAQFFVVFIDFLVIAVIFGRIPQLAGWSFLEVAFLYATSAVSFHLADVFISEVELVGFYIRTGTFDRLLVRPLGPLFQLCCDEFSLRRVGKLAQGVAVLSLVLTRLDVDWDPGRAAMVVVMVTAGAVIFGAVWVAASAIAFWLVDSAELANSLTYGGNYLSQYPLPIYGAWLRRLLAFVVPMAFVNFFPALYVLDHPDPFRLPGLVRFLSPAVAVAAVLVAREVWRSAVRHYRSTGT